MQEAFSVGLLSGEGEGLFLEGNLHLKKWWFCVDIWPIKVALILSYVRHIS